MNITPPRLSLFLGPLPTPKVEDAAPAPVDVFERPRRVIRASERTVAGARIVNYSAPQAAVTRLSEIVELLLKRPDVAERARAQRVSIVLIPERRKMTDLPEFAALAGTYTFDGRLWNDVRGMGGLRDDSGRLAVGVPVENLLGGPNDGYGPDYSVAMHEISHAVFNYCITDDEREEAIALFAQARSFVSTYAMSNYREYFAEATTAFFDREGSARLDGRRWLREYDPQMYALLSRIYAR